MIKREDLRDAIAGDLPGEQAHFAMAPDFRGEINTSSEPLYAGVMILAYPADNNTSLVFIKRNVYDGPHSGQVSFPGGAWEPGDDSMEHTALRETREELGISEEIDILGSLTPLHIPVSNFMVTPFAGWTERRPVFHPDPQEVQYVIESTLEDLLDPRNIRTESWKKHNRTIEAPYYSIGKEKIWGATAMILSEFLQLALRLP